MALPYVIKNTFVSLDDEESSGALRRTNSEPSLVVPEDEKVSVCQVDSQSEADRATTNGASGCFYASTPIRGWGEKAFVLNPRRGWTTAAAAEVPKVWAASQSVPRGWGAAQSDTCAKVLDALLEQPIHGQSARTLSTGSFYDNMSDCQSDHNYRAMGSAPSSTSTCALPSLDCSQEIPKQNTMQTNDEGRQRLNPHAKSWEPSDPSQQVHMPMVTSWMPYDLGPTRFAPQGNTRSSIATKTKSTTELKVKIGSSVTELRYALKKHPRVSRVDIVKGQQFWNVTARLSRDDLHKCTDAVLSLARAALLNATDESSGVFLLGYQSQPFVPTNCGFSCMLGGMVDPSCACWDTFSTGVCNWKGACTWHHPVLRTVVNVMLTSAETETGN